VDWVKNFDVAMAAGLAIVFAAIAVKNRDGILVGLGIFGLGYSEHRMNRHWA
jgi:hypothetical protein